MELLTRFINQEMKFKKENNMKKEQKCNFCNKSINEVERLASGGNESETYICNICVLQIHKMLYPELELKASIDSMREKVGQTMYQNGKQKQSKLLQN